MKRKCEFTTALGGGNFIECKKDAVGEVRIGRYDSAYYKACKDHMPKVKEASKR
jgi:hypothetical protein